MLICLVVEDGSENLAIFIATLGLFSLGEWKKYPIHLNVACLKVTPSNKLKY